MVDHRIAPGIFAKRMMIGALLAVLVVGSASMAATTIGDGQTVTVGPGETVTGPVTVESGGTLILNGGNIDGGLTAVTAEEGSIVEVYAGVISGTIEDLFVKSGADVKFYGSVFYVNDDETQPSTISSDTGSWNGTIASKAAPEDDDFLYSISVSLDTQASVELVLSENGGNGSTNEPPEAVDDDAETTINTPVTIDVLDNDYDPDDDPLTIVSVTEPDNGTATFDGELVTYTPMLNFVGTDEFDYTISDGKDGTASATVTVTVKAGIIEIDIKPGDDTNRVNLGSNGVIPVAIFSTEDFDATNLDPETIFLAGAGVRVRGKGNKYLASEEDVNGDGRLDLVVKVETQNLEPDTFQDGGAYLRVHTEPDSDSTVLYEGWDSITIVPPDK